MLIIVIKSNIRKLLYIILSTTCIIFIGIVAHASANTNTSYNEKEITMYFRNRDTNNIYSVIPIPKFPRDAKITHLKSSNTKIALVKYNHIFQQISLKGKRPGNIFITFKMTVNKKSKLFKYKITLKNEVNPCINFKIGNKNYAHEFDNQSFLTIKETNKNKQRIRIKPRSGWIIIKISKHINGKSIIIKNNSLVSFKKAKYKGIYVIFKNQKTKRINILNLYFKDN